MRVRGIEPRSNAWEAFVLPLNYTRDADKCSAFTSLKRARHCLVAVFAGPTGPRLSAAAAAADSDGKNVYAAKRLNIERRLLGVALNE